MERLPWQMSTMSTNNINLCTRSHPYQHEARRLSHPAWTVFFLKEKVYFPNVNLVVTTEWAICCVISDVSPVHGAAARKGFFFGLCLLQLQQYFPS